MAKKQKSGLYRTKIKVGVDANGKDINKWISGKTKRELEQRRQEAVDLYISGVGMAKDRVFGAFAVEWYEMLKQRKLALSSLESYRTALNKDILPEFGNRNLRSISAMEMQEFVYRYNGKSETKITYIVATLNSIFEAACVAHIISINPVAHIMKPEHSEAAERRALTEQERKRVLAVARAHKDGAYLACLYYLGVRPGECRGLMWQDFDWEQNLVHVQRDIDYKRKGEDKVGDLKNASSNRYVPIPQPLKDILFPLRSTPDKFLFAGERNHAALSKTSSERLWLHLMCACNMVVPIQPGSNKYRESDIRSKYKAIITPHGMRHNYITMCWESGIDVYTTSRIVGHKSIKTTLEIYTHLSEIQMRKTIAAVADMFDGKKNPPTLDQLLRDNATR